MHKEGEVMAPKYVSILSQLYHFVAFTLRKPKVQLENGMLIVSVDVDVGSKEIGVINNGENDANVHDYLDEYSVGEIEERALPLFIDFFNGLEIPATFAIRGQLTEVNAPILKLLIESSVEHDIGAHGYYHKVFTNLSKAEAEDELKMISVGMKKFGVTPKSFVFPRGEVAHLSLLEKYGYKCYRGYDGFRNDDMYVEKHGQLYNVQPSFYIGRSISPMFLKKIIDISVIRKLPFHVWFHPWNFGETKESMQRSFGRVFRPLFKYAKEKEKSDELTFETMLSTAERIEMILK